MRPRATCWKRVRAKADARTLTLLGNTYRQLGQLGESEAVLSEAVDKAPESLFLVIWIWAYTAFRRTLRRSRRRDSPRVRGGRACRRSGGFRGSLLSAEPIGRSGGCASRCLCIRWMRGGTPARADGRLSALSPGSRRNRQRLNWCCAGCPTGRRLPNVSAIHLTARR